MEELPVKYRSLRRLMVAFSLLWALLLASSAAPALSAPFTGQAQQPATTVQSPAAIPDVVDELNQGAYFYTAEATTTAYTFSLQPAIAFARVGALRFAAADYLPPYAARAPGLNFLTRFFPTSIQPNAP